MLLMMGYVSLALLQMCRQYLRKRHYSSVMLKAAESSSVLVLCDSATQNTSVPAGIVDSKSPLVTSGRPSEVSSLMADDHLVARLVSPKQKVDLNDWTSYMDIQQFKDSSEGDLTVLLEAWKLDTFQHSQVPLAFRVHVLKHGIPVAWKAGCPFGIVLRCTNEDFVHLCDAFGQGYLTLDDSLRILRLLTVTTVGKPRCLSTANQGEVNAVAAAIDLSWRVTDPNNFEDFHSTVTQASHVPITSTPAARGDSAGKQSLSYSPVVPVWKGNGDERGGWKADGATSQNVSATSGGKNVSYPFANTTPVPVMEDGMMKKSASPALNAAAPFQNTPAPFQNASAPFQNAATPLQNAAVASQTSYPSQNATTPNIKSANLSNADRATVEVGKTVTLEAGKTVTLSGQGDSVPSHQPDGFAQNQGQVGAARKVSGEPDQGVRMQRAGSVETNGAGDHSVSSTGGSFSESFSKSASGAQKPAISNGNQTKEDGSLSESFASVKSMAESDAASLRSIKSIKTDVSGQGSQESLNSRSTAGAGAKTTSGSSSLGKSVKPPNIVVYCGNKDTARKFTHIKMSLEQCVNTDTYTIYLISHDDFIKTPWEKNSAMLIVSHDYLYDNVSKKCSEYLQNGGRVVSFGSSLEAEFLVRKEVKGRDPVAQFDLKEWKGVSTIQGRYVYTHGTAKKADSNLDAVVKDPKTGDILVVRVTLSEKHNKGKAIFSQLMLERDPSEMAKDSKSLNLLKQSSEARVNVLRHLLTLLDLDTTTVPPAALTPCFLLAKEKSLKTQFLEVLAARLKEGGIKSQQITLKFVTGKSASDAGKVTADLLPVLTEADGGQQWKLFDPEVYWQHLTSSVMGSVVLYTDVIPTTMTLFGGMQFSIPENVGVVAIAGRQTSGKGREGNAWLSPEGCAMFSLPVSVSTESLLGQRPSFIQHIMSLAVVHSIRTMDGYEDLDLRLKWPNDIYYGGGVKIGGVLVNSTVMGNKLHAVVGCGVNVSNAQPTLSINSIIEQFNRQHGTFLKPLSTSEVIARTVSTLEQVIADFQQKGHEDFCMLYYQYWLHSGTHVRVESEGKDEVEITGLDDFGFLRVVNKRGDALSLHPDGNSFDMLHNLISTKS